MIIVSNDKKCIINLKNIKQIRINPLAPRVIIADGYRFDEFATKEIAEEVFAEIINGIEKGKKVYYMP